MNWNDKVVLITGGTGSFGKKFTKILLAEKNPVKVIIFSRDELKQHEMQVGGFNHPSLRYFIGDIRDRERLVQALDDYVLTPLIQGKSTNMETPFILFASLAECLPEAAIRRAVVIGSPGIVWPPVRWLRRAPVVMRYLLPHMPLRFLIYIGITALTRHLIGWVNHEPKPDMGVLILSGGILILALTFVVINLVVDLLYAVLDPRIRYRGGRE